MRKCILAPTLIALFAGATTIANRALAARMAADEGEIRALYERYEKAFQARDVNTIMSAYAAGDELFVFDVTPPRQHVGWADYKKDWEDLFAAYPGPLHDEVRDLQIHVASDVAYGHHIESGYFTRRDGSRLDIAVRVSDVYRKRNGKWLIVQEHVSVPVDLDTAKADLLSKP